MRFQHSTISSLVAVAALAALAACSGATSQMPPGAQLAPTAGSHIVAAASQSANHDTSWISPAAYAEAKVTGLLFISNPSKNEVSIFSEDRGTKPIGKVSNGLAFPGALAVDRASNLYVANGTGSTVTMYAPPYTGAPKVTYASGLSGPTALAVSHDGTLYVAEATAGPLFGQIVVFPPHKTTPSLTIPITFPFGITTDSSGNLYVSPGTTHDVEKFAPGSTHGTILGLQGMISPAGLAFDSSGNLVVVDEGSGLKPAVYTFAPGSKTSHNTITAGLQVPETIAVATRGAHIFVGDSGSQTVPENITEFAYPAGVAGRIVPKLSFNVAVSPPAPI
ncbi:MAG: hypothetical protein ABI282_06600 [Candidatus Baltobacteraceae bacterium]